MGAKCGLYGVIGRDNYGKKIYEICTKNGIELKRFCNKKPTIMKERIIAHGQQVTRLEHGEWNLEKISRKIQKRIMGDLEEGLDEYNFIILSDYDKIFFSEKFTQEIISIANSKNIPTLVDAKPQNIGCFRNCLILRPNEKEAEKISGIKYRNGKDTLIKISEKISKMINCKYVIITCGADGVFSYDRELGESLMIETKAKSVADVTGAGDTFAAALALGLSSELKMNDSVRLANYASGVVVEKVGTATSSIEEIIKKIEQDKKETFKKR
jgi:rfaE bifunctional protein kinase chain/domain